MRLPPGLCLGPRWGAYSAPKPPAGKGWVTHTDPPLHPPFNQNKSTRLLRMVFGVGFHITQAFVMDIVIRRPITCGWHPYMLSTLNALFQYKKKCAAFMWDFRHRQPSSKLKRTMCLSGMSGGQESTVRCHTSLDLRKHDAKNELYSQAVVVELW